MQIKTICLISQNCSVTFFSVFTCEFWSIMKGEKEGGGCHWNLLTGVFKAYYTKKIAYFHHKKIDIFFFILSLVYKKIQNVINQSYSASHFLYTDVL
jgi:hypothetical protein